MSGDRNSSNEGYQPDHFEKGYQPSQQPAREPTPQGGYQPTSEGENPANAPPGKE
jgi:hypothetical protein